MTTKKQVNDYWQYLQSRLKSLEEAHAAYQLREKETDDPEQKLYLNSLAANCWTTRTEIESAIREYERAFLADPGYVIQSVRTYGSSSSIMEIVVGGAKITIDEKCKADCSDIDNVLQMLCTRADKIAAAFNPPDLRENIINDFETVPSLSLSEILETGTFPGLRLSHDEFAMKKQQKGLYSKPIVLPVPNPFGEDEHASEHLHTTGE